jgi:hypothetical protein
VTPFADAIESATSTKMVSDKDSKWSAIEHENILVRCGNDLVLYLRLAR